MDISKLSNGKKIESLKFKVSLDLLVGRMTNSSETMIDIMRSAVKLNYLWLEKFSAIVTIDFIFILERIYCWFRII